MQIKKYWKKLLGQILSGQKLIFWGYFCQSTQKSVWQISLLYTFLGWNYKKKKTYSVRTESAQTTGLKKKNSGVIANNP